LDFRKFDELKIDYLIRMPYTVNGAESCYDLGRAGGDAASEDFFEKMRRGASVKTQALNQANYVEYFEPFLKAGEDVLYVTFTHKMSATFLSMDAAIAELKEKYPDRTITTADSKGISMAAGIVVYYAAKLHNSGASDAEVVKFVEEFRERIACYFTVDDLVYLKRGGRLSGFKALMGTMLNLKPIITITDGALDGAEKVKGRKKAIATLAEKLESEKVDLDYPVTVLTTELGEDYDLLNAGIKERFPSAQLWPCRVGPVIGCHCGPGTLGVVFVKS
jgi:DegV family protein with EDD domain